MRGGNRSGQRLGLLMMDCPSVGDDSRPYVSEDNSGCEWTFRASDSLTLRDRTYTESDNVIAWRSPELTRTTCWSRAVGRCDCRIGPGVRGAPGGFRTAAGGRRV